MVETVAIMVVSAVFFAVVVLPNMFRFAGVLQLALTAPGMAPAMPPAGPPGEEPAGLPPGKRVFSRNIEIRSVAALPELRVVPEGERADSEIARRVGRLIKRYPEKSIAVIRGWTDAIS